jgi:hypothetical protein
MTFDPWGAEARARDLLRGYVTGHQFNEYIYSGYVSEQGRSGIWYRVGLHTAYLFPDERPAVSNLFNATLAGCYDQVHYTADYLPQSDRMLSLLLLLRADENAFLAMPNWAPWGPAIADRRIFGICRCYPLHVNTSGQCIKCGMAYFKPPVPPRPLSQWEDKKVRFAQIGRRLLLL